MYFYRFAFLRAHCLHKCGCLHIWGWYCLHKCGWFLIKTMICTFVGCLHILTASCLHISGWCIFFIYFYTDLHKFWGRRVCTNVVVCTFEGKIFAQMWLFAHLWFLHISPLHTYTASCLHISGWCIFLIFFFIHADLHIILRAPCLHKCGCLHIWGRNVCTTVVVCTFLFFLHISRLHRPVYSYQNTQ